MNQANFSMEKIFTAKMVDPMEFSIAEAEKSQFSLIADAEADIFSNPWSEKDVADTADRGTVLAAVNGRNLLGYAIGISAAGEGEILRLGVLSEYRGIGLGRALLTFLTSSLYKSGAGVLFLEVRESNTPARALYLSCGFTECGRRKKYYSSPVEDAVIMSKLLKNPNT